MRDLLPILPALVLPAIGASTTPGPSLDNLVADLEARFDALEAHCLIYDTGADIGPDFGRLDAMVTAAVQRIADIPAPDLDGLRVKARLLIESPPVREDEERSSAIGVLLSLDVLRLLGPGGWRHGS
ncbi:hypothetical protein D3273_25180 [Lichenibacterium minor]|uniref:Uncharacterized protein n=1 Tax=Lichenibacterium minor TaxID=2316528 RepID=A0A4V1RTX9_9HYPH|nr:hypothetical protein [Lichenibacterium minor]RYC29214.1 hypothetical protein D3273_25180 [Lichenibacterium minor]